MGLVAFPEMPYEPTSLLYLQAWVLLAAWLTALLEIQIEGAHGWAARLPTWRYGPPWLKRIMGGKDITGYHVYLVLLQLCFLHFPVLFVGWSPLLEVTVMSCYFCYAILWDFLWFTLNPHFGLKRFSAGHIWWFSRWIGPLPSDYYPYLTLSSVLAASRGLFSDAGTDAWLGELSKPLQHLVMWVIAMGMTVAVLGVVALVVSKRRAPAAVEEPIEDSGPPAAPAASAKPAAAIEEEPFFEEVAEAERLQRAQWLIQFGELIFGIVVGLSISRIADTKLFSPESTRSLGETLSFASPLLVLYCWMVLFIVLYWYNMRLETPVFAIFIRQSSGVMHLVLVVVLGFIVFQGLDAVLPNFSMLKDSEVLPRVDTVMRWLGLVIFFDFLSQTYLRALWLKSFEQLERANVSWASLIPGVRAYYGLQFPAKTVGLLIVYLLLFFPRRQLSAGRPALSAAFRGWPGHPEFVAFGFVLANLACESYLAYQAPQRSSRHAGLPAGRPAPRARHGIRAPGKPRSGAERCRAGADGKPGEGYGGAGRVRAAVIGN